MSDEIKYSTEKVELLRGKEAIAYLILNTNVKKETEMIKLFVEPERRGKGIAGTFMKEIAIHFKDQTVVPICPYCYSWYKKHSEYTLVNFPKDGPACRL